MISAGRSDRKLGFVFAVLTALFISLSKTAAVSITGFSPTYGSNPDYFIAITGSGFYPGTLVVKYGGANGTQDFTAQARDTSGTIIQSRVPTNAPVGSGPIYVSVNGVGANSQDNFTVIGPGPYITGFSPAAGSPGDTVLINGIHFTGTTAVRFNGTNAPGFFANSDIQIQVTAPVHVTTGPITVAKTGVGTNTTSTNFWVPPFVTSFSPVIGRAGTNVTIRGTNFTGVTAVLFSNTPALQNQIWVTNNNLMVVQVPPGASAGPIRVETPANNPFVTTSNFVVQPTVYGFSPGAGTNGTVVTVTGANFNGSGLAVRFGGVPAAAPTGVTFGSLTVKVPAGATNAPITVTNVYGSHTSTQIFYLPPTITGITPNNGAFNTTIQVTGQNLLGASAVTFTGTSPVVPTVTNNTTMGVVVPAGVITGPISVTGPAGTTNSGSLLFYGAPVINGFSPNHGLTGTNVTILGTNFLGVTGVKFGGTNAVTVNFINNGQITALVPTNARTGLITVTTPGGVIDSANPFTLDTVDISVGITDQPDPVVVGSNLVYTITVANNSTLTAPNVTLTNALPDSVNLKSATTTQGSLITNAYQVRGSLGALSGGGTAVVTLTVVPQTTGTITNSASAGSDYPDSTSANNSSSITTLVWPVPVLSIAGLTNQVQVSWPGPLSNLTLQFMPTLAASSGWSNLNIASSLSGGSNVVVDSPTNASRFYRLKQ